LTDRTAGIPGFFSGARLGEFVDLVVVLCSFWRIKMSQEGITNFPQPPSSIVGSCNQLISMYFLEKKKKKTIPIIVDEIEVGLECQGR
jgi:hypothetical protein